MLPDYSFRNIQHDLFSFSFCFFNLFHFTHLFHSFCCTTFCNWTVHFFLRYEKLFFMQILIMAWNVDFHDDRYIGSNDFADIAVGVPLWVLVRSLDGCLNEIKKIELIAQLTHRHSQWDPTVYETYTSNSEESHACKPICTRFVAHCTRWKQLATEEEEEKKAASEGMRAWGRAEIWAQNKERRRVIMMTKIEEMTFLFSLRCRRCCHRQRVYVSTLGVSAYLLACDMIMRNSPI